MAGGNDQGWSAQGLAHGGGDQLGRGAAGRAAATLADRSCDGHRVGGSSISAVHFERTTHRVPQGGVSADQRGCVVRGGVEPPTFRFSGQPR